MKKIHILVCLLLIVAAAIATLMYYPDLPASIPVHWNFDGMPDKYGPRAMLYLLGPGLMGMMLILGLCLPWFSPRRFGLASFKATYSYFIVVLVGIFGLLYAVVLHAILTDTLEIQRTIYVGVFMLLILLGNPMGKVKRNRLISLP